MSLSRPANAVRFLIFAALSVAAPDSAPAASKTVVGRVERVWIKEADAVLRAKIDTGAHTTSLDAQDIHIFKRGGADWVRFVLTDDTDRPVTIERKVVRFAKLKENERGGGIRPVITLGICLADIYRVTQVNLVSRTGFAYKLLIGRRFLFGRAVVDVARQYISDPRCKAMRRK